MTDKTRNTDSAVSSITDTSPYPVVALGTDWWNASRHQNGVVAYTSNLVEGFKSIGVPVCVIANNAEPGRNGVPVRLVPTWPQVRRGWPDRVLAAIGRRVAPRYTDGRLLAERLLHTLRQARHEQGIQIFETEESSGVARLIAPRSPVPVVVRLHGPWFLVGPALGVREDLGFHRRLLRERIALERAAGLSAPSRDVIRRTEAFYQMPLPHACVIPNPIGPVPESQRWSLHGCDPERLLFVGRFDRAKGADILLDAFADLLRERPTARLTFVGSDAGIPNEHGSLIGIEEYLRRRFPDPAARSRIEWVGLRSPEELLDLRRNSFACVIASRYESFSMVTLEAMACGCPIVAPDVGGIPEMIRHQHNGILYSPGSAAALARELIRLMKQPALAQRLGEQAVRHAVGRYDPPRVAGQTLEFYNDVLASSRGRSA